MLKLIFNTFKYTKLMARIMFVAIFFSTQVLEALPSCLNLFAEKNRHSLAQFPNLETKLKTLFSVLENDMVQFHIKSFSSKKYRELFDQPILQRSLPTNSLVQEKIRLAYNRLHSFKEMQSYILELAEDSIAEVLKRGLQREVEMLRHGTVPRNAMLRVLVRRFRERGQKIDVIKGDSVEEFSRVGSKGPFFDKASLDSEESRTYRKNLFKTPNQMAF